MKNILAIILIATLFLSTSQAGTTSGDKIKITTDKDHYTCNLGQCNILNLEIKKLKTLTEPIDIIIQQTNGNGTIHNIQTFTHEDGKYKKKNQDITDKITYDLTWTATGTGKFDIIVIGSNTGQEYARLDPFFNNSFAYRINITTNSTKINANLTNFPIYLDLDLLPDEFFTNVQTTGADIRITQGETTEIPREITWINTTAKTGEIYFKGNISNETNTNFYIYYGNPTAAEYNYTDTHGRNNVWTAYVSAFHFQYDGNDSSGFGTATGNASIFNTTTDGIAGESANFSGGTTWLQTGWGYPYQNYTIEGWLKTTQIADNFFCIGELAGNYKSFCVQTNTTIGTLRANTYGRNSNIVYSQYPINTGTFQHYAIITNATGHHMFINGTFYTNQTIGATDATQGKLIIGTYTNASTAIGLLGQLDEIRVANTTNGLSPTWISTEYNNIKTPSTFFIIGEQEVGDSEPPAITLTSPTDEYTQQYNLDGQTTMLQNFSFEIDDMSNVSFCWLFINDINQTLEYVTPDRNTTLTFNDLNITTNQENTWIISCIDSLNNLGNSTENTFTINTNNITQETPTTSTTNPDFTQTKKYKPKITVLGINTQENLLESQWTIADITVIILLILGITLTITILKRGKRHEY